MSTLMVVEDQQGRTVNFGAFPKGNDAPVGLDENTANADADERNRKAVGLGIKTRYKSVPLEYPNPNAPSD